MWRLQLRSARQVYVDWCGRTLARLPGIRFIKNKGSGLRICSCSPSNKVDFAHDVAPVAYQSEVVLHLHVFWRVGIVGRWGSNFGCKKTDIVNFAACEAHGQPW